jgi:undecaprenyl-diphosphatase
LKAGLIGALCYWAWFKNGEDKQKNKEAREAIISAMLACLFSIVLARLIVMAFPFRIRPLADPTNGFHFPAESIDWQNWSSFPSDNAILFFMITTCLFSISRVFGWIALLDTVFLICLPRVYLGIHYPTDILAGAAMGIGIGLLASQKAVNSRVARIPFLWLEKHPGSFYAASFLLMFQVTAIFWDVRYVASGIIKHVAKLFGH